MMNNLSSLYLAGTQPQNNVVSTLMRRRIDVDTTLCRAYWVLTSEVYQAS